MLKNQKGYAHLVSFIVLFVILAVIVFAGIKVMGKSSEKSKSSGSINKVSQTSDTPPLRLKSIGFNLDYYNPATQSAGEMQFIQANLFSNEIWGDFGQQDPRTSDQTKKNPQPTYVLPLSVKVQSLVDGQVNKIQKLYSDDFSIMVTADSSSQYIYETEHVVNPLVKVGDKVKGGQIIADVSPHGSPKPGYGILEIGILHPENNQAGHLCPYKYLDPSIKADIQKKITSAHEGWNQYTGMQVYDLSKFVSPGCVTEDWVRG